MAQLKILYKSKWTNRDWEFILSVFIREDFSHE
jgi:hypothetical protein